MSSYILARRRTTLTGAMAVIAALVTGLAIYSYLSFVRAQMPIAGKLVPLVVAAADIEPGTTIDASLVKVVTHPQRYLPPQSLHSIESVLGKITTVPIFAGEALTARRFGVTGGRSSSIPKGLRAFTLTFESAGALGTVPGVGDRVDVIATFTREVLGEASSVTILRQKEVAEVVGAGAPSSSKVGSRLALPGSASASIGVTLFVTPTEAQKLAMAESLGRLTLVLAPVGGDEAAPPPMSPTDLAAS